MVTTEETIKTSNDKKIFNIYQSAVQKITFFQWFYLITIYSAPFTFLVPPFIKYYLLWDETKFNASSTLERPLPFNFLLPFDDQKYYLTGFALSSYCTILGMGYYCFTQSLFVILPSYISFRLKVLIHYALNNKEYSSKLFSAQKYNDKNIFRFCVEEHIDIIRTVKNLNDSVKYLMLLEFLMSSAEISFAVV
ncbi:hypothetical protein NQ314_009583 [Rhamnusium bicolor]|uniref:Uncharacterized protein n=1 Tax=Rhamnusium bicolor TaxID=1586634 RepID=A0AAV8XXQ0_9CUCU|nr:hypothetical protein NQ314_009583 [Rhamnusium bicolor]